MYYYASIVSILLMYLLLLNKASASIKQTYASTRMSAYKWKILVE